MVQLLLHTLNQAQLPGTHLPVGETSVSKILKLVGRKYVPAADKGMSLNDPTAFS